MRGDPDDPTCETGSNGDDGLRSDGIWRSCVNRRSWMTLYA